MLSITIGVGTNSHGSLREARPPILSTRPPSTAPAYTSSTADDPRPTSNTPTRHPPSTGDAGNIRLDRWQGKGWQRTGSFVDTQVDPILDDAWKRDLASGSKHVLEETWVPANDPHYDAKLWPCAHPYGTGSLLSEPGSFFLPG